MGRVKALSMSACFASLAIIALATARAEATEVTFPKEKPRVAFDVPDGWAVTYTADGLELRSPEKNSFVLANMTKRARPEMEAWTKQAIKTMMSEGVAFDKNVKAPPVAAAPAAPTKAQTPAASTAPAAIAAAPFNPFTLSGEPSPEMKTAPPSEVQPQEGPVAMMPDSINGIAKADRPKMPFKVVQYYGASFAGKPVDVQLVLFRVSSEEMFLMEQASGSDDNRAVGIITSVKAIR